MCFFFFLPFVLQAQTEHPGDSAHTHRWTSLELVKGTYSTDDSPSDIAEIRLDKAVPLKVRKPVNTFYGVTLNILRYSDIIYSSLQQMQLVDPYVCM